MTRIWILITLLLLPVSALAETDDRTRNRAVIDEHIIPAYQRLAISMIQMREPMAALCVNPSNDTLSAAQAFFQNAMTAWQSVQHIRFGPVAFENRLFRISFWPDHKNFTGRQLRAVLAARDERILAPGVLKERSVAVQGLMALERLLFGDQIAVNDEYACAYAEAIVANLIGISQSIETEWTSTESWRDVMLSPGPENPVYQSDREVTVEIFKVLTAGFQILKDQKLLAVMGTDERRPRPRRAEAWRSQRSFANVRINLDALIHLVKVGFWDVLIASNDGDGAETVQQVMREANLALDNMKHPLPEAVTDKADRKWLNYLLLQISTAQDTLAGEIVPALALPLSFNALDGD